VNSIISKKTKAADAAKGVGIVEKRLAAANIVVPNAPMAAGNYAPFIVSRGQVYISGQTCRVQGLVAYKGAVGRDLTLEEGKLAARICAINLLSQLKAACDGDLDRVARCVRLGGFVCSVDSFTQQPEVLNGASDVILAAFGDAGRHARTAVGVAVLPSNSAVEVDAVFELHDR
jgi:enamine deaminase RidA (YjgF/YER057c/UK114 family)